jgi:hypothetical protein
MPNVPPRWSTKVVVRHNTSTTTSLELIDNNLDNMNEEIYNKTKTNDDEYIPGGNLNPKVLHFHQSKTFLKHGTFNKCLVFYSLN